MDKDEDVELNCECQLCFRRWTSYTEKVTCPKCGNRDEKTIEVEEA